jgi:hypothetical protein
MRNAMVSDTELRLSFWRDGSTKAERLAAVALDLAGYEDIDPQSPLGGPDGKRDLLCQKGGLTWVGAVYFPNSPVRFAAIKKKYVSDLSGAPQDRTGFVFITNQTLSPDQRKTLSALAHGAGKESDIIHLQELTNLLDSPSGYGARLQFLKIGMTIEEQLSWAVENDSQTAKAVTTNTRELLAMRALIERMSSDQTQILRTLNVAMPGGLATPDLISVSSFAKSDTFVSVSENMSPALILLFHRLTCFDLPSRMVGQLRNKEVWLADREGNRATHAQPPPPEDVGGRLVELCDAWNRGYEGLRTKAQKLEALARFHAQILLIHPFLDGNGRVARAILMQQCLDLFGRAEMSLMKKGADYYEALRSADRGDLAELALLIETIVYG